MFKKGLAAGNRIRSAWGGEKEGEEVWARTHS